MPFLKRFLPTLAVVFVLALIVSAAFWGGRHFAPSDTPEELSQNPSYIAPLAEDAQPTRLYAHNLELRKGPHFRVYIRFLRGELLRANPQRNPSFDIPESFQLELQKGIVYVKLADIADFLNSGADAHAPLRDISLSNEEGQVRLHGTAHKGVSLPVRLDGTLSALPDGRLKYHLVKLNVLKMPLKGLFGLLHISLSDLVSNTKVAGVQIAGDDVYFDTQALLPPPHIRGHISSVTTSGDQITVIYGDAKNDEGKLAQWHNFLRLAGGTLDFGKLTMHQADLTLIDATEGPWFDLDLANYQTQLINGTTRVTAKAGLEVYMPNASKLTGNAAAQGVTLEWLRDRNTTPPLDVSKK